MVKPSVKSARGKREACITRSTLTEVICALCFTRDSQIVWRKTSRLFKLLPRRYVDREKNDFVTLNQPLLCLWFFRGMITRSTEMSMEDGSR